MPVFPVTLYLLPASVKGGIWPIIVPHVLADHRPSQLLHFRANKRSPQGSRCLALPLFIFLITLNLISLKLSYHCQNYKLLSM